MTYIKQAGTRVKDRLRITFRYVRFTEITSYSFKKQMKDVTFSSEATWSLDAVNRTERCTAFCDIYI